LRPARTNCSSDQGESAEEPVERAELQEYRHEPSDRGGCPLVREKERLNRSDHKPLGQDAVSNRYAVSDDPGHRQGSVLPIHDHTPLYGKMANELPQVNTLVYG
jgi:hypothetical protein